MAGGFRVDQFEADRKTPLVQFRLLEIAIKAGSKVKIISLPEDSGAVADVFNQGQKGQVSVMSSLEDKLISEINMPQHGAGNGVHGQPKPSGVYAGLITVDDLEPRETPPVQDDFAAMVALLKSSQPGSGSDALAILRVSYPHVPLARRVAAMEAARR